MSERKNGKSRAHNHNLFSLWIEARMMHEIVLPAVKLYGEYLRVRREDGADIGRRHEFETAYLTQKFENCYRGRHRVIRARAMYVLERRFHLTEKGVRAAEEYVGGLAAGYQ